MYREGGTYSGAPSIMGADTRKATVVVPPDAAGKSIHVVLKVTDSGSPRLTTYRRMVLNVRAGT
jgi:hypothetical protein